MCCLQETQLKPRDKYILKVRGWKKIFHVNGNQKKAEVAIPTTDKIYFKIKTVTRDNDGHHIMIKGSIQEELTLIININIYVPNISATQYIRQTLIDTKELDSNTVIVKDF